MFSSSFSRRPGCYVDQRPVYVDSYGGSLAGSNKKDYFLSDHLDLCSSAILMQLPKPNAAHGPSHQQSEPRPHAEEGEASWRLQECVSPSSSFMGRRASAGPDHLPLPLFRSHVLDLFSRNLWESSLEASQRPAHGLRPPRRD